MLNIDKLIETGHMNPDDVLFYISVYQGGGVRSGYARIEPKDQTMGNISKRIKKISGSAEHNLVRDLGLAK